MSRKKDSSTNKGTVIHIPYTPRKQSSMADDTVFITSSSNAKSSAQTIKRPSTVEYIGESRAYRQPVQGVTQVSPPSSAFRPIQPPVETSIPYQSSYTPRVIQVRYSKPASTVRPQSFHEVTEPPSYSRSQAKRPSTYLESPVVVRKAQSRSTSTAKSSVTSPMSPVEFENHATYVMTRHPAPMKTQTERREKVQKVAYSEPEHDKVEKMEKEYGDSRQNENLAEDDEDEGDYEEAEVEEEEEEGEEKGEKPKKASKKRKPSVSINKLRTHGRSPVIGRRLRTTPRIWTCQYCGNEVVTEIQTRKRCCVWLSITLLCLFCCCILAWIPCVAKPCRDVEHICPKCDHPVANFDRFTRGTKYTAA